MPRQTIALDQQLEYLSILDENGDWDEELEPEIDDEFLSTMYRYMVLARLFDQRMLTLQSEGKLGTFAPVTGQEAAQIGTVAHLRQDDWMVPSYREIASSLWRNLPMVGILLYNAGYNEGAAIPEDNRDFPPAVPVGTQPPHAVGLGYASKYRGTDEVVMTYFGDGATSQGDFHEAMNFAGVFGTPTIFVCQNNHWAISVPRRHQTASRTLAQKGLAYGMPALQVDGNDILATYVAAAEAVDRARRGEGPTIIECVTYRLEVHTTVDDPSQYREQSEVKQWWTKEPISRFEKYLKGKSLLTDDDANEVKSQADDQIEEAWREAQTRMESLDDPQAMFDHIYDHTPAYLQRQRDTLVEFLDQQRGGEDHA